MKPSNSHIEKVKNFFDDNALMWQELYLGDYAGKGPSIIDVVLRDRKDYAIDFLAHHLPPSSSILDVGCGTGVIALELLRMGYGVHGVDISSEMIHLAEKAIVSSGADSRRCSFSVSNISELELTANSFDAVLALGFIEYQENPIEMLSIFRMLLRPEGVVVISSPLPLQIANWMGLLSTAQRIKKKFTSMIVRDKLSDQVTTSEVSINRYNLRNLARLLNLSGFTVIDNVHHGFADIFPFDRLLPLSWNFMIHKILSRYAGLVSLDNFANNLIVVARKK